MSVTSWIRRQFKDGVSSTDTLPSGCSAGATTLTLANGSSFPDGSIGPFIVTIDQGLATEEKVLIQSRSSATLTVASSGRGYNGTTAQGHGTSASVLHTIDAQDLDEANQTAVATLGAVQATGDLLIGGGANSLTRLARGAANTFLQTVGSSLQWTAFGVSESQTVGGANSDGTQTTPARSDHVHQGVTSFNGSAGAITGVNSFNTRTGAVVPGNADYLAVATGGLTGATTAIRFVGGTASAAPSSGTFSTGDVAVAQNGGVFVCTAGGTPGTWTNVGVVGNPAGSMANTGTATTINNNATAQITGMASVYLKGGVTFNTNALTVPVTGIYAVTAAIESLNATGNGTIASGAVSCLLEKNGVVIKRASTVASTNYPAVGISDIVSLAGGDALTLFCAQSTGATAFADTASGNTIASYVSCALVSQ